MLASVRLRNFQNAATSVAFALAIAFPLPATGAEVVRFWHTTPDVAGRAMIDEAVDRFNRKQKAFVVKPRLVAGSASSDLTDAAKLKVAVASGTGPDVFLMDRFTVAERASVFLLENLTPYLKKKDPKFQGRYLDFAMAEASYKGRVFALPTVTDTRALVYRKDVLQQRGVDPAALAPDKGVLSLKKFMEIVGKVDRQDEGGAWSQLGFVPWLGQGHFFTWSDVLKGIRQV